MGLRRWHRILFGSANDTIFEPTGNNVYDKVGSGTDTIIGGTAFDKTVYSHPRSSYTVTRSGLTTTVSGPDGTDTLRSVELLQFSDATMPLAPAHADLNSDGTSDILWRNGASGSSG